ncbi:reelin domain-containing protein 1 [Denticeps clupeoides]|uniref:reelin domain-containing protein 1 n=1 Tax=Denticeps clupeoides TaxID=299321 RepID=UPI0010A5102D|nr:reelin domain-containing protein 1-like [Denticeps clupeoides]
MPGRGPRTRAEDPTRRQLKMHVLKAMIPAWLVCVMLRPVAGFSHGAASSSCWDMKPGHVGAQRADAHTHTTLILQPEYLPRHTLTVTVRSSRAFMGFLLQARSVQGDRVVGEFIRPPPGTKLMGCVRDGDSLTHSDKLLKKNMSFTWRAPDQAGGDLHFYLTVVQSYFVYWSHIKSAVVHDGTRSTPRVETVQEVSRDGPSSLQSLGSATNLQSRSPPEDPHTPTHTPAPLPFHQHTTHPNTDTHASVQTADPGPANGINAHAAPAGNTTAHSYHPQTQEEPTGEDTGPTTALPAASPVPRLSISDPLPTPAHHEPTRAQPDPSERPPGVEGEEPRAELGLLLSCSAGLGVVLTAGLRCLHRRHCRRHSGVSLHERHRHRRRDTGVVHVQEGGDLVQVRRIRQNSFLVLQGEDDLLTPPGS